MRFKSPKIAISPGWFFLAVCLASLCLCNMLSSLGTESLIARPTATSYPTIAAIRSFLAPPATNANVLVMTPDFAGSVPMARTTNFDVYQFDLGRRTYTQWCATCHGDRGQGLALWRSSWDPGHQNCTKSGCHGARHAAEGFTMVKIPPPLIGQDSLAKFQNTFQLYAFIRGSMPYQAPMSLSDTEYWAVTAYLADQHGADAVRKPLTEANAMTVLLPTANTVGGR